MDVTDMDERQRLGWLRANRATLFLVGLVWLGMIGWELAHGRGAAFLIAMVPVFALFRYTVYRLFTRAE